MPDFQKLPDPFLYGTEALIADLDSVRELILRIPVHNNTVSSDQYCDRSRLGFA
jgi:hypothetical protein